MKSKWVKIGCELFDIEHLECARVQKNHLILYYTNEEKYQKVIYFPGEKGEKESLKALEELSNLMEAHRISLSETCVEDPNIYETFYKWDFKSDLRKEIDRVKHDLHHKYKEKYERRLKKLTKSIDQPKPQS